MRHLKLSDITESQTDDAINYIDSALTEIETRKTVFGVLILSRKNTRLLKSELYMALYELDAKHTVT